MALLEGDGDDIIQLNVKELCKNGMNESFAMHVALKKAKKGKAADRATERVAAKPSNKVRIK